ncbi:GDP-L-fucose synthase family protein [Solimonas terrae]|nr:GDP-L-fucose synthase [Solimonas terrae]
MSETGFDASARIYVAGHRGLAGAALVRRLRQAGAEHLILRRHDELDLTNQAAVEHFFAEHRPDYVFLAAARVGGIRANSTYPAEFVHDNLAIQNNIIHSAWRNGTRKLLFLGSSCIYPKLAPQPLREDSLLTAPLESSNEWYAIAKIAGIKTCQAYRRQYGFDAICAMPTNLYGPGDNFDPLDSHVLPGLIRRFHEAVQRGDDTVTIWGTGTPLREFMHVDDLADAALLLMQRYSSEEIVNIGSGDEVSIAELAQLIAEATGFRGRMEFDPSRPDGTPRKRLDTSRMDALGWKAGIRLQAGIVSTYAAVVADRELPLGNIRARQIRSS